MCGIFALFGPEVPSEEIIRKYFIEGSKRGPETSTLVNFKNEFNSIYFGFHRLAINGLNSISDQPIYYKDYVLICNGEIFNYKELIDKYNFKMNSQSDCEVIIHLFDKIGKEVMNELDGEFSFIIYNKRTHNIFIGRDPYGVRPLYVNRLNGNFVFSSDLLPLQALKSNKYNHVSPGTLIEYEYINGKYIEMDWFIYNYTYINSENYKPKEEKTVDSIFKDILCSLKSAIKKRVSNSERPLACLLSGGLDSSIVAAFSAKFYKELTGGQIETYSIGLSDSEDLKFSKLVAEHIGSKHTQIICTEDDFFNAIPNVIRDVETYDTTTVRASVGNWLIGKYIKENSEAKVVLNGDGADEVMGGYLYFHASPTAEEFDNECKRLLSHIHYFDVLRSDKSISSHGLEPRTPYLDKDFVSSYLSLPSEVRYHKGNNKPEKYVIREIISEYEPTLLPNNVLNRKKEAFSDGVSGLNHSWYQIIQSKLEKMSLELPESNYSHNLPKTKEQQYYRFLFQEYYKGYDNIIPYFWMPKFVNATDASARTLNLYNNSL
jgi:asparagine synthase (glutamine-hydrolysing)